MLFNCYYLLFVENKMTEKPREYKKRLDAEWRKNERNKNKLIKKIKEYELLDERYKEGIEAEILEVFSKKEKEEKGEEYENIVKVIEDIDKKYEDLNEQRANLVSKEKEEQKVIEEMEHCELDAEDNTTLNKQWKKIEELEEKSKKLKFEIEEMKKEISDKEEEVRVIEENYWKKEEEESVLEISENQDENIEHVVQAMNLDEVSLKQFREETIKDLWGKDRKRLEIIKILEEWAWIWDDLSEKIERKVTENFFEYYNESLWNIDMEVASFLRNSLRKKEEKYEEIKAVIDEEEKQKKLKDLERVENAYSWGGDMWREILKKKLFIDFDDIKELWKIWWKSVFEVKLIGWANAVYRWDEQICGWYEERIWKIQEIWWEPVFKVKNKYWKYVVYRWYVSCCAWCEKIWKIQEIWWKPFFKVSDSDCIVYRCVYRWDTRLLSYEEIWKVQEIWWKPFFEVIDRYGQYEVYRWCVPCCYDYEKSWKVQEIWWKPVFKVKNKYWMYKVYRWYDSCGGDWSWIGKVKNFWWVPVFEATSQRGDLYNVKWYSYEKKDNPYLSPFW